MTKGACWGGVHSICLHARLRLLRLSDPGRPLPARGRFSGAVLQWMPLYNPQKAVAVVPVNQTTPWRPGRRRVGWAAGHVRAENKQTNSQAVKSGLRVPFHYPGGSQKHLLVWK